MAYRSRSCEYQNEANTFFIKEISTEELISIIESGDTADILQKFGSLLKNVTSSDSFVVYLKKKDNDNELVVHDSESKCKDFNSVIPIIDGDTAAGEAAATLENVLVENLQTDYRFSRGVIFGNENNILSLLCLPVIHPKYKLLGVIELRRNKTKKPFKITDFEYLTTLTAFLGIWIGQSLAMENMKRQYELSDFMLEFTGLLLNDLGVVRKIISKILLHARRLVDADRTTLFMLDNEKQELIAEYFSEGGDMIKYNKEIRVPLGKGIAGYVAITGSTVNAIDCYSDPRFLSTVDNKTGYLTKNLLCSAVKTEGNVVGVLQMINKKSGICFTEYDQEAMEKFAKYCALALHYSKLFQETKERKERLNVVLDMFFFHCSAAEKDVEELYNTLQKSPLIPGLDEFMNSLLDLTEEDLPLILVQMVETLLGKNTFSTEKLCRFILAVKKNYRPVPYHNFWHAVSVTHCMYCILSCYHKQFTQLECEALLVAAVCHDIDHRGLNNRFMEFTQSPLAALYNVSVMEQHHYQVTVSILQQNGHDIFSNHSNEEYTKILHIIKDAILGTDFAFYVKHNDKLKRLLDTGTFDLTKQDCRNTLIPVMMTCCDLASNCKVWEDYQRILPSILEEFYTQGDKEKQMGCKPLPMMDRDRIDKIPEDQIFFLEGMCLPLYETLVNCLHKTEVLRNGIKENINKWKIILQSNSKYVEEHEISEEKDETVENQEHKEEDKIQSSSFKINENECESNEQFSSLQTTEEERDKKTVLSDTTQSLAEEKYYSIEKEKNDKSSKKCCICF
ncbi:cAMP and cAMP-inhibited cGMP 3',5'-cyclic phosphodiesterase 10A-like [Limulus polyphemus]|uniref:Phosphodiesterase n=1 Tax=Limulus polyphemus TaxID=6850 RepID=A0ABM1S491_LIMPO|nr:cAMP and cAMP-inhibited cGMP 3',5'-cyclic phosphodiesterase 10A-like [Limulus polyphemus]